MEKQIETDCSELFENSPRGQESVTISVQVTPGRLFMLGMLAGLLVMAIPLVYLMSKSNATLGLTGAQEVSAQVVNAGLPVQENGAPTGSCGAGGGGCGCGGGERPAAEPQVGTVQNEPDDKNGTVQVIRAVYTYDKDILPNTFAVKKGLPVRFELDVREDGQGCMSTITIPDLNDQVELLTAGQKIIMEFTPVNTGEYPITCAMGVPWGTINVVD